MTKRTHWLLLGFIFIATFSGCDNMRDGNRLKPYEESTFFEDGNSSRPLVDGTVPRGYLRESDAIYKGKANGAYITSNPFEVTQEFVERGQERFNIYCSICHGHTGFGDGMVVRRGFKEAPSLHEERLRNAPEGYFFDVITNGFGSMYDYKAEITPKDRWAIISYIRALQLSQNATLEQLSSIEIKKLDQPKKAEKHNEHH